MFARLAYLLVFVVLLHRASCRELYQSVEQALQAEEENLENLRLSFFRTNHPKSIVIDVNFFVNCSEQFSERNESKVLQDGNYTILKYRWLRSSINLFIRPEELQVLSLYTFQTEFPSVNLTLDLISGQDCFIPDEINKDLCDEISGKDNILEDIGDLVANLQFYANHPTAATLVDNTMGYALLAYTNSSSYKKCCVLNQSRNDYDAIALLLPIASCIVAFVFSIGTPSLLVALYERLYNKMDDKKRKTDSDWLYMVWAVAVVAFLLTLPIIGTDVTFLLIKSEAVDKHQILYATIFCAAFVVDGLTVFVACLHIVLAHKNKHKLSDFPIPCQRPSLCYRRCVVVMTSLACYFFTLFLTFAGFHGFYIVLGVVASPVVTLSRLAFVVTGSLCLVAFMAFFLKYINKSQCPRGDTASARCAYCSVPLGYAVVTTFFLFASVVMFGVFYYFFSEMIENYHHGDDLLSVIGAFLPSGLLAFAGFCGKKLLKCLNKGNSADGGGGGGVGEGNGSGGGGLGDGDGSDEVGDADGGCNGREGGDGGGGGDCCCGNGNGLLNCFTRRKELESEPLIIDGQGETRHQEQEEV